MNPQIKNNPEWKPLLDAVRKATETREWDAMAKFIYAYPSQPGWTVALALSLAKWSIVLSGEWDGDIHPKGMFINCGCCMYHNPSHLEDEDESEHPCFGCPLARGDDASDCIDGADTEVYTRILKIYTEHFNALPARDRQKVTP